MGPVNCLPRLGCAWDGWRKAWSGRHYQGKSTDGTILFSSFYTAIFRHLNGQPIRRQLVAITLHRFCSNSCVQLRWRAGCVGFKRREASYHFMCFVFTASGGVDEVTDAGDFVDTPTSPDESSSPPKSARGGIRTPTAVTPRPKVYIVPRKDAGGHKLEEQHWNQRTERDLPERCDAVRASRFWGCAFHLQLLRYQLLALKVLLCVWAAVVSDASPRPRTIVSYRLDGEPLGEAREHCSAARIACFSSNRQPPHGGGYGLSGARLYGLH